MGLFAPKSTISVHKIFLYYTYKPNNQDFTLLHKKPASTLRYFYIFCLSLQKTRNNPMKKYILTTILCMISLLSFADNTALYLRLDSAIALKDQYTKDKEQRIEAIRKSTKVVTDRQTLLKMYNEMYNEYHYFRFDSAMTYVKKGLELAIKENNEYYRYLNTIHESMLLATCGLYSEARTKLDALDENKMDDNLKYEYTLTQYWLYTYWSDYSNESEYRDTYWYNKIEYLKRVVPLAKKMPNDYNYLMGEYFLYVIGDGKKALPYYNKVLSKEPENSRLYSTACFAVSCIYAALGDEQRHEEYLIKTVITDIVTPVKENMSFQELAMLQFRTNSNPQKAELYIQLSMDDAKFYNNRLRIIDISNKLPAIVDKYKEMMKDQNRKLRSSLIGSLILLLGLIITSVFIFQQNKLLRTHRRKIAENNKQLTELNTELSILNGRLTTSNEKMQVTNVRREALAKLYIDLCSKYIERLHKYQLLVCRKIKANQAKDLLSTMTSSKLSDEDAATFMHNFDKAFLDQYPTFVTEFNALLLPDQAIITKPNTLTTELRIFALVRLGVKESSEIANLLFYTPRTIYNYRSATKSKAINKDSFEDDVLHLCSM